MPPRLLPPGVDLELASLAFALPRDQALKSVAVAKIKTSPKWASTTFRVSMSPALLRVVFDPLLFIDLPFPLGDMGMKGVSYDFVTGELDPSMWYEGGGVPVGLDQAKDAARGWMRDLITGTAMAIRPYRPLEDEDLVATLMRFFDNLRGGGEGLSPSRINQVTLEVALSFSQEMRQSSEAGGVRVPQGGKVSLRVELAGDLAALEDEARRKIERIVVESSGIVLSKDGEDQAAIKRLTLRRGGAVSVDEIVPLGPAATLAGVESLIRIVGALSTGGAANRIDRSLAPELVNEIVRREVEKALGSALLALLRESSTAAPGLDIGAMLEIA